MNAQAQTFSRTLSQATRLVLEGPRAPPCFILWANGPESLGGGAASHQPEDPRPASLLLVLEHPSPQVVTPVPYRTSHRVLTHDPSKNRTITRENIPQRLNHCAIHAIT